MKYFCYISSRKVDDLYAQLEEGMIIESNLSREIDASANISVKDKLSLLKLLGVEVEFGAEGKLQYGQSMKKQCAQKLKKILEEINKENGIYDIKNILKENRSQKSFFYYCGTFRFDHSPHFCIDDKGYVDGIAILTSDVGETYNHLNGYKLKFACSANNFSDTRANGKYQLNSTNYHFFEGGGKIKFETVFVKNELDVNSKIIHGSPLFLALENEERWI